MTNLENYKKRKLKELSILNEYISDKIDLSNCDTEKDILEYKNLIIKNLRNDNQINFQNELFDYHYTYERFNGFIKIDKFANSFYNLSNQISSEIYFYKLWYDSDCFFINF